MAMEPSQAQVTPEKVRSDLGMTRNLFLGWGGGLPRSNQT